MGVAILVSSKSSGDKTAICMSGMGIRDNYNVYMSVEPGMHMAFFKWVELWSLSSKPLSDAA